MNFLRPTKLKIIASALIILSMWGTHKMVDMIIDPILQRLAPDIQVDVLSSKLVNSEGPDRSRYIQLGLIFIAVDGTSRGVMSYLCACLIIAIANRKKENTEQGGQGTLHKMSGPLTFKIRKYDEN